AGLRAGVVDPTCIEVDGGQGQVATIGVPESAVNAEQDHRFESHAGGIQQLPDFVGSEEFGSLLRRVQPDGLLRWAGESGAELDRRWYQAGVKGVFEDGADVLDVDTQAV